MHVPRPFAVADDAAVKRLIQDIGFGLMVSPGPSAAPAAMPVTALPLLLEEEGGRTLLRGHIAAANGHRQALAAPPSTGAPVTVLFQGAHAYISPDWYEAAPAVPTWNYELARVTGRAHLVDDPAWLTGLLDRLSARYEDGRPAGRRWRLDGLPGPLLTGMLSAIVGVEIEVESLQAATKFSQNKTSADRAGVIHGLLAEGDGLAADLARRMRTIDAPPPAPKDRN